MRLNAKKRAVLAPKGVNVANQRASRSNHFVSYSRIAFESTFLRAAIPSFRLLGCDLSIELLYLGESDLSEDFRTKLDALPGDQMAGSVD
ncbi:hypothetical protein PITC_064740 [Penicillium italicum]|uniref:Uncharacterized protein n=1 Tax=Penicillium italicum TaxID=40296 RepID=A0A0A2KL32_PENIT|nr:hypothetical protein PITC_064740 [Penicillium italicum]